MSLPTDSVAPAPPTGTSNPWSLVQWWKRICDWIAALSPSGASVYDTGWQNITIASGWATQGSQTPQVRRVGSAVMMRGIIRPDPAGNIPTSSSTIATIPVGYRPGAWTYYSTVGSTASTNIRMIVKDNGEIEISASNTSSTWVSLAVPPWIL